MELTNNFKEMNEIEEAAKKYADSKGIYNEHGETLLEMGFKAGAEFAINGLINKFEKLKLDADTLRDELYLDGVIAAIEVMKMD